eukprot:COSAG06_NODE_2196_length_7375_cov_4.349643_9_plen_202_part_00
MQLKREHSKAEQKATQLQRDIEFERYQKKGLQQLVDSFASTPADAPADEDEEEESGSGGAKKSGATTAVAAGQEKAKQDAAALAEAQASLKKCESRISELEERRAELDAANATLTEQAAKCADAETEAAVQLARAETATKATTAAEALLSRYAWCTARCRLPPWVGHSTGVAVCSQSDWYGMCVVVWCGVALRGVAWQRAR